MNEQKPRICIIEPCHSHEEVLLPLVDLLHEDYEVYVIAPQSLLDVDIMSRTKHLYTPVPIGWKQGASRWRRLLSMPGKYREIRRLVDAIEPRCILFNSSYALLDLLIITILFSGVCKAQIIHNCQSFLNPWGRWFYSQFKLNLVISEEVHRYMVANHPRFASLEYVLPIFFNEFISACPTDNSSADENIESRLKIAVVGTIDNKRRNYDGLLNSMAAWVKERHDDAFVVYLMGKISLEAKAFIEYNKLASIVRVYDQFVSFEELFRVLGGVDIVLFLIDSTVRDCALYNRYKISGTSTLIKGFQKCCASSLDFKVDASLKNKCVFYSENKVEQLFEKIAKGSIGKENIRKMERSYKMVNLFDRETQKNKLVALLKKI